MTSLRRIRFPLLAFMLILFGTWYYFKLSSNQVLPNESTFKLADQSIPSNVESGVSTSLKPWHDSVQISTQSTQSSISSTLTRVPLAEPTRIANTNSQFSLSPVPPADVLLVFKTGASTIWRRMPLHLSTILSGENAPESVIYSDLSEQLSHDIHSIDVLQNVSDLIRAHDPAAFSAYQELQSPNHVNTYREHGRLPGDEPPDSKAGNPPGWLLDKYKFLPMLTHAQNNWPDIKWTIYVEDDTYIFMDNVLQWLATLSSDSEPAYYGAYSGGGNETFAQGGSGMVFSRSLMRSVFGGRNVPDLEKYGNYTSQSCCGDIVLGKVLRDYGIFVNKGDYGSLSFRPEPPWKTGFDELIWCTPVFTFHHLHQKDIAQLAQLERAHLQGPLAKRPLLFRDVFKAFIAPYTEEGTKRNWDNFASRYPLNRNSTASIPLSSKQRNVTAFSQAFSSSDACKAACFSLDECLSWRHESAASNCVLDTVVRLGREVDPLPTWAEKTEVVSGWMTERIDKRLIEDICQAVKPP